MERSLLLVGTRGTTLLIKQICIKTKLTAKVKRAYLRLGMTREIKLTMEKITFHPCVIKPSNDDFFDNTTLLYIRLDAKKIKFPNSFIIHEKQ